MFCFNTLTNLAEVNGLIYLKNLLQELDALIKETNQQLVKSEIKIDVEPLIALLEHVYTIIIDIENNQMHSSLKFMKESSQLDTQNAKNIVIEFISELVLDKGGIIISENLFNIFFQSCEADPHLQSRLLYIILKNHVLEENKMEVKDFIMKKLRVLMVEHVRMFKEIYDREQELRVLLEEYQEIVKEEESEGIDQQRAQDEEDAQSFNQTDDNLNDESQTQTNLQENQIEKHNADIQTVEDSPSQKLALQRRRSKTSTPKQISDIVKNGGELKQITQISINNNIIPSQNTSGVAANHNMSLSSNNEQDNNTSQMQQQNSLPHSSQQQLKTNIHSNENINIPKSANMRRKSSQSSQSKLIQTHTIRKKKIQSRISQLQFELEKIGTNPLNIIMIWKFLERPVRNYEGIQSISNAFFWEYFKEPLTEYQHILLNFMFTLIIIHNRSKNDSIWRNLILQNHDIFLKVLDLDSINVYKQPGFLFAKYMGETLLTIFQNKGKKSEVIKSDKFTFLRKVLLNSKIRDLVDISKSLETSIKNK